MRKIWMAAAVVVLTLGLAAGAAFACDNGGCKLGDQKSGLESKFYCKAQFLMKNQDELGLSDDQITKIKDLKMKTKKDLIMRNAEIDVLALEIKSALYAEKVDINAVNSLVDKKYDLKKKTTKDLISACVAVKDILTKEQKDKLKALWKKCDSGMKCDMGMKCEMGKKR